MLPMPFGDPTTYAGHSGIDFPQARGTLFRASGHGRVRNIGRNERGGNYIWVNYDGYPAVGYHHMDRSSPYVVPGTEVWEGSPLGLVGSLGKYSNGPHLHSEVEGRATASGYWTIFDRSRVVGQGNPSGGGGSTPSNEGFLMALSDAQQEQVYNALVKGGLGGYYATDSIINVIRTELAPAIASIAAGGILYPGQPYLAFEAVVNAVRAEQGQNAPEVNIDEAALAASLAPLIAANLGTLTDATVNDLIDRLLAEQSKRLSNPSA